MSRLFVALSPPPGALAEVAALVDPHRAERPELRWVQPALWHVTLAFLGEVPDAVLPDLHVRLARAVARYPAMTLAFQGAGAFPSAGRARVFWTGLSAPDSLKRLAESVAAGAQRAGAKETDRKPFHPHLTLARARRNAEDLRSLVEAAGSFSGGMWTADTVRLMRSHLGPAVRYETVEAYPLAARD